jgi:hypothetical protein
MAVDQPVFFHAGLDPVAGKKVVAFDEVRVVFVQKVMGVFCRFDGHAIARQHVEMRGTGKGAFGCLLGV